MSSDSLAVFRKSMSDDMKKLAEQHMQHDLTQADRDALQKSASTVATYTGVGSMVGIGLGLFLAYRLRATRTAMFNAFKAKEKPTSVHFAGGREEPVPDLTKMMEPSTIGSAATYTFLGLGGLFFGGETGLLVGSARARQRIGSDKESLRRIATAFRRFQADSLRAQADRLDKMQGTSGLYFSK